MAGTDRRLVADRWVFRPTNLRSVPEDKVVAVALLLEPIYEQEFKDFSYGFRPGRRCHDASHRVRQALLRQGITCVIDCDISSFFDNLQHDTLLSLLKKRVNDGILLRLIRLMLEGGSWTARNWFSRRRVHHKAR